MSPSTNCVVIVNDCGDNKKKKTKQNAANSLVQKIRKSKL
jgi:hypothetical protein